MLIVRAYRQSDAARCCDIILACLPLLHGINEPARAFLRTKLVPEHLHGELSTMDTYVAVKGGEVVGLVALDGQHAKRLYVHPSAQRQGVGRVRFDHVEQLARLRGLDCLLGEASPAAASFYESVGFETTGTDDIRRGEDLPNRADP